MKPPSFFKSDKLYLVRSLTGPPNWVASLDESFEAPGLWSFVPIDVQAWRLHPNTRVWQFEPVFRHLSYRLVTISTGGYFDLSAAMLSAREEHRPCCTGHHFDSKTVVYWSAEFLNFYSSSHFQEHLVGLKPPYSSQNLRRRSRAAPPAESINYQKSYKG